MSLSYGVLYADSDSLIAKVVSALNRAADRGEPAGLDTEFYGVKIREKSCVAESKLHLISVAIRRPGAKLHPRGFFLSDAAVLPRSAIDAPGLRAWLGREDAVKAVHNLPVDAHTIANAGAVLRGAVNTLAMARWAWPVRARAEGFTLDALGRDMVGLGKTESYADLFTETVKVPFTRTRKVRGCECGEIPRKGHPRSNVSGHVRFERVETVHEEREERKEVPLELVTERHRLWARVLNYSAQDAVLALAVYELAVAKMKSHTYEVPWYALG